MPSVRVAANAAVRRELARAVICYAAEVEQMLPRRPARTSPCRRCGVPVPVIREVDVTQLSDPEPRVLPVLGWCPTVGCGTTCVTCRRRPGEVHGPHCWDRMRLKINDPHIVDDSDCKVVMVHG